MTGKLIRTSSAALLLALTAGAATGMAQPPENRGKAGDGAGSQAQAKDRDDERWERDEQYREERQDRGQYRPDGNRNEHRDGRRSEPLDIDEAAIRSILRDERSHIQSARSLPPGIRKNLERGKPLPPGIAKQFDGRVESRLPRYPGYDWRQVGTDAVLIEDTTGLVVEIIDNVLQ